jgi:phenylacetate-coenzyme A ligase PaaK-like adenylate-forming protein
VGVRDDRNWNRLCHAPAAELKRVQDERLASYVREELYPFSAHYRRVFDEAGVDPGSVRSVADLARLPFTTKQDLLEAQTDPARKRDFILVPGPRSIKAHWPFGRKLALVLGGGRAREALRYNYTPNFATFTTGRSTEPVVFTYTPHDLEVLGEATARMFDLIEVAATDERVINMMPFAPHLAFWAVTLGGFAKGVMVLPTGGGKSMGTAGNLRLIERMKGTAIVGTPGFVYHMLRSGNAKGTDFSSVRKVTLGAEKVPPGLKIKMIECLQRGGAGEVVISGTYGFTEARMAWAECPAPADESPGYHLYPDLGVFEVVDPESGEPVGEGQDGELVYTGISGHGSVVCRYRTGDMVVGGLTWEPCPWCKRTLPRISSELRRVSERHALSLTKIKGTLVDLSHMGTVLSEMRDVEEWQVVISKKNDDPHELDQLEVRVAARDGAQVEDLKKAIWSELQQATEVAPNGVTVHPLEEMLELLGMETQMKEQRFLDRRPK